MRRLATVCLIVIRLSVLKNRVIITVKLRFWRKCCVGGLGIRLRAPRRLILRGTLWCGLGGRWCINCDLNSLPTKLGVTIYELARCFGCVR